MTTSTKPSAGWSLRLQEARILRGWSQAELGRRLTPPVTRGTIHAMEQGLRVLDVPLCERLAEALGCKKEWLAGWSS